MQINPANCRGYIYRGDRLIGFCRITTASDEGATLVLEKPEPDQLPNVFRLKFSQTATNYRECLVLTRASDSVAVQFTSKQDVIQR